MPDAEREELIVHEFGHAILGLDHEDNTIMQAQGMLGEKYYTTHYSDLLNIHFGCLVKKCINETYNPLKYSQPKETPVTLKEILENEHAVIRLTATWCPPCKVLAPIFNEIAAEHPDVKVYVIDVDENKDLAGELNVRGIPTCIAIRNNKVDQVMVGAQPKQELEKLFK
jgi:thioredoxin 1